VLAPTKALTSPMAGGAWASAGPVHYASKKKSATRMSMIPPFP
jgi:hypothetical protein